MAKSFYSLAVGCDMPFLNRALLSHMINVAPGFDVVIPRVDDMVEPLHAVYSKNCLAPIEGMVARDNLSVHSLLGGFEDIQKPLVGSYLKLFSRLLVYMGGS